MTDSWSVELIDKVGAALRRLPSRHRIELSDHVGIHLAIFVDPFLDLMLDGKKTVESRFGVQRCAPHGRVAPDDVLLLKRASGPVVAVCRVRETWFFDLVRTSIDEVRARFAEQLCAEDPAFWSDRAHATLATLMRVERVTPIEPLTIEKRDRRGWVTLRSPTSLLAVNA